MLESWGFHHLKEAVSLHSSIYYSKISIAYKKKTQLKNRQTRRENRRGKMTSDSAICMTKEKNIQSFII
jgi:hypothetical protein